MSLLTTFEFINNEILAVPTVILFLGAAVYLTLKSRFLQFRGFSRLISICFKGLVRKKEQRDDHGQIETMSGLHALSTAMATAIGTGSIVAPSLAIMTGGPGALFWLVLYLFFGSVTKFCEIFFAITTRKTTIHNKLLGGPMQYLAYVSPYLAYWYGVNMIFMLLVWETVQANNLAVIFTQEGIPQWLTGTVLAGLVGIILCGGAQRVGSVASKLVPFMFFLYVSVALFILFKDFSALGAAFSLIIHDIFSAKAVIGATLFRAIHVGVYRGIFICEAGVGTSSIPHSLADTKNPRDQSLLGLYSTAADMTLSIISGLLVIVTGVWLQGEFRSSLVYEAFKVSVPVVGQITLLIGITLFVFTTVVGNGFNGMQTFASFTRHRFLKPFIAVVITTIFFGAVMPVALVWEMANTSLACAAIPHLIGLLILVHRNPDCLN